MNYIVTDKDGWTLVEGRIQRNREQRNREQRNREEAARIVDRIERNQRIERLVMASKGNGPIKRAAAHLQPETNVVDFIHRRSRGLHAPMATRRIDALKAATWLTTIGIGVAFWYCIYAWVF